MTVPAKKLVPLEPWQQELVKKHSPGLIVWVAKKYFPGQIPEDIISEGNLALTIAASRFDRSNGAQFKTYAVHWVRALVLTYMMNNRGPVRFLSSNANRKVYFGLGKAEKIVGEDTEIVARRLGVSKEAVDAVRSRMYARDLSLNVSEAPLHIPTDEDNQEEVLGAEQERDDAARRIGVALDQLDARERLIIRERKLREVPHTLSVVGRKLGISRERIRQIEEKALRKMKMALGAPSRDKAERSWIRSGA